MQETVKRLLEQSLRLEPISDSPLLDAQLLLAHCLRCSRASLMADSGRSVSTQQRIEYEAGLKRRETGEPLAYILGSKGFWDFDLLIDRRALVPRPETELLVERALACLEGREGESLKLLDLGTGSGAIALALARASSNWLVTATDIAIDSLELAAENARHLAVVNLQLLESCWYSALEGRRFDLIVSNPPYVAEDDPHLESDGLAFEPSRALVAGEGGLAELCSIIDAAQQHLYPGAWLFLEHGFEQGEAVSNLLESAGFESIRCWQDLAGLDRVSSARVPF